MTNDIQSDMEELQFNITVYGMDTTKCNSQNTLDSGDTLQVRCNQVVIPDQKKVEFDIAGSYRPREGQFTKKISGQLYVAVQES